MNRIDRKFQELKKEKRKAFVAFITAGYPNLKTTKRLILEFSRIGVDILELGVPFSDPLADGPMIQEASQEALKRSTNIKNILRIIASVRAGGVSMPIALMTYYNPVFCFGQEHFAREASLSGVDGVIVPDLPPEEARTFRRVCAKEGLDTIFFLSPTSTLSRIRLVSDVSKGFIYYVSLTGVTGAREKLPPDIVRNIKVIKRHTDKPVCVGFGVSNAGQVKEISEVADGVIVGSAIVREIKKNIHSAGLVSRVGGFVKGLMAG